MRSFCKKTCVHKIPRFGGGVFWVFGGGGECRFYFYGRADFSELNRGVSKPGGFPLFSGKVQIVSRTLSGLFLVGALNRLRKRKRTNRENPWTIPAQIGKIPEKSGKSQKGQKRTKKEGQVQIGKPPRLNPPRLAALDWQFATRIGAIRGYGFAQIDSQKTPIFITFERFARIASNLRFAIFCPRKRDSQQKGFSSGTLKRFARIRRFARICYSLRAHRAI